MAQTNQPKKRTSALKKDEPKTKKLTPKEIALINRTQLPLSDPEHELNIHFEKYCSGLFQMFLQKLLGFMEIYAGYHTRAQIMEMYGVSKNTLSEWIKNKGLPFYKIDKKVLIKKSDLEKFLEQHRKVIIHLFIFYLPELLDSGALMTAA
jgi:excisionase family DNA binding protein